MEISQASLVHYLQRFVRHPHPLLATLEVDAAARGVPIIGPWGGQILSFFARSIQAQRVLELGTATGYSTLWLATATADWDGRVITIDQDAARVHEAQHNLHQAGVRSRVQLLHGAALTAMQDLAGPFDLILNDVLWYLRDVKEAQRLYTACLQRLRPGGLLLCDNALRGGTIMLTPPEPMALGVKAFTEALLRDPQLDTALIPIRDGLLVCRKHVPTNSG